MYIYKVNEGRFGHLAMMEVGGERGFIHVIHSMNYFRVIDSSALPPLSTMSQQLQQTILHTLEKEKKIPDTRTLLAGNEEQDVLSALNSLSSREVDKRILLA